MLVVIGVRFHEDFVEDHIMYKERTGARLVELIILGSVKSEVE